MLFTAYFAFFVTGMTSTILGAILPDLRDAYGLSYVVAGSLYSFHQIGNLCAVFLAGVLPYIIGRKKSVTILFSALVIGTILITLSPMPVVLMIAYACTGIGRGNTSNITNVIVSEHAKNKARGLNLLHAIFACGALFSPFLLVICSSLFRNTQAGGWRITLWIMAFCMLCALVLFATSALSNTPERRASKDGQDVSGTQNAETVHDGNLPPFYRSFDYWLNVAILLFYLCGESGCTGWLVTYFKDSGLFGETFAKLTSSFMWLMVMIGRLSVAVLSRKLNKSALIVVLAFLNTAFFVLMIASHSSALIIAGLLGTGLSMSGIYPTTLSTMHRAYNTSPLASGIAIGSAVSGGIFMPVIVGAVSDRYGVTHGISCIALALGIMLTLTLVKLVRSFKK